MLSLLQNHVGRKQRVSKKFEIGSDESNLLILVEICIELKSPSLFLDIPSTMQMIVLNVNCDPTRFLAIQGCRLPR